MIYGFDWMCTSLVTVFQVHLVLILLVCQIIWLPMLFLVMAVRIVLWTSGLLGLSLLSSGVPPFHDDTLEKVFENIIYHKIEWHDDLVEFLLEARDFMECLICTHHS